MVYVGSSHSTIGDSQHRVILTFLLSVVLTLLTLSHNTCHLAAINCSFRLFCEKTALEVLNTCIVLLKQYTEMGVNRLITIGNKAKANIQITNSYSKLCTNKNNIHYTNEIHSSIYI